MTTAPSQPLAVQLARASWLAPLLALLANGLLANLSDGGAARSVIITGLSVVLYLTGLVCGVAALFGVRRHGRAGILLPALVGSLLSAAALLLVAFVFRDAYTAAANPQAQLERAAARLREGLPMAIDEDTTLDDVTAGIGELIYDYTLVGYRADQVDPTLFAEVMKPELAQRLCEPMAVLWAADFTVRARYRGSDGDPVADIALTADDCPAP